MIFNRKAPFFLFLEVVRQLHGVVLGAIPPPATRWSRGPGSTGSGWWSGAWRRALIRLLWAQWWDIYDLLSIIYYLLYIYYISIIYYLLFTFDDFSELKLCRAVFLVFVHFQPDSSNILWPLDIWDINPVFDDSSSWIFLGYVKFAATIHQGERPTSWFLLGAFFSSNHLHYPSI